MITKHHPSLIMHPLVMRRSGVRLPPGGSQLQRPVPIMEPVFLILLAGVAAHPRFGPAGCPGARRRRSDARRPLQQHLNGECGQLLLGRPRGRSASRRSPAVGACATSSVLLWTPSPSPRPGGIRRRRRWPGTSDRRRRNDPHDVQLAPAALEMGVPGGFRDICARDEWAA